MYKKILVISIIVILCIGNVYFYNKSSKLDYAIKIGTPSGTGTTVEKTDFSEALSDKEEANILTFSLMEGISIEKPEVCNNIPTSTIWFNDWNEGVVYYIVNLWEDGDTIIVETDVNSEKPLYKKIDGSIAVEIKKLIDKYTIK